MAFRRALALPPQNGHGSCVFVFMGSLSLIRGVMELPLTAKLRMAVHEPVFLGPRLILLHEFVMNPTKWHGV